MLFHDYPPELTRLTSYSDYLTGRAMGENKLNDFSEKLRDFAVETDFMSFYNSCKTFYDKTLTLAFKTLGDLNYIKLIEDYYGEKKIKVYGLL